MPPLNGLFDETLASIDPTADNAVGNLFASLDPSQQLEELKKFLNSPQGRDFLKLVDITMTVAELASTANPVGAILFIANELAFKPAFEMWKLAQLKQMTTNQLTNLYHIRKIQWATLQEIRNKKNQINSTNAEIERQKKESDKRLQEIKDQITAQQNAQNTPQPSPEPPTESPKTEKTDNTNYYIFFGLATLSGASALYFRKNKKGLFVSVIMFLLFVVFAFVFGKKKKENKTENKTLNGAYNNEDNFYTPEAWANLKKLENGIGTLDLTQNAFNIDKDKLQASLDSMNPFLYNVADSFLCENYTPKDEDIALWNTIQIDINEDYLAKMVTYNCKPNAEISRFLSDYFNLSNYNNFLQNGTITV